MNEIVGRPDPNQGSPGRVRPSRILMTLAVATGAVLRFQQIRGQILSDDEWHAVHKLLSSSYFGILSDFGLYDHSILLTLYYKALAQSVGLSELSMRLPALLAGTLAVAWIPHLLRPCLGARCSLLLAWMMAVAPLQIHYSRIARPYALTLLLATTALAAFHDWLSHGGSRRLAVFLSAWTVSATLHLPALMSIPGPFLYGLLASRHDGRERPAAGRVLKAGFALALLLCLVLALPTWYHGSSVTGKIGYDRPDWSTFLGVAELFFGVSPAWLLLILGGLAILGGQTLARRSPRAAVYLSLAAGCQITALIMVAPQRLDVPIAFARYCLWMQPVVLGLAALGATRLEAAVPLARGLPWMAVPLLTVLTLAGPLRSIYYWPNNWTGHPALESSYGPPFDLPFPSPYYDRLADRPPGSLLILEAPWYFHHNAFVFYQRRHRQRMMIGFIGRDPAKARPGEIPGRERGIELRNAVHVSDLDGIRRRGVDLVIFHKRLAEEMADPHIAPLQPLPVQDWIDHYRASCGPPEYEDAVIAVFAVRKCSQR